jgi:hypothetical protein
LASLGIVKVLENRSGDTYPDLPWEPKAAFHRRRRLPRLITTHAQASPANSHHLNTHHYQLTTSEFLC